MARALTHLMTSARWVGTSVSIETGSAVAELVTHPEMAVDDRGLVHGGFVFGLADYAAMLAVNDPHVVLGASEVRFIKPVCVGDVVLATARVEEEKGRKRTVTAVVTRDGEEVLSGTFTCFVLEQHVLGVQ